MDVYRCFIRKSDDEIEELELKEKFRQFRTKMHTTTLKCGASLVLASVGAGVGALIHPSHGQWIGKLALFHVCLFRTSQLLKVILFLYLLIFLTKLHSLFNVTDT